MKIASVFAAAAVAAALLAGCAARPSSDPAPAPGDASAPTSPTTSAGMVFDPLAPLEPQMKAAIQADDLVVVTQILGAGYDPEADLGSGLNALHVAASGDHPRLIAPLVAAGVPLEVRAAGLTPLQWAAEHGSGATVTALVDQGADITVTTAPLSASALHLAAHYNNVAACQALISAGIDINTADDAGGTPLIFAAYYGAFDSAEFLVNAGADLAAVKHDATALSWAISQGHEDIAAMLQDAGAPE